MSLDGYSRITTPAEAALTGFIEISLVGRCHGFKDRAAAIQRAGRRIAARRAVSGELQELVDDLAKAGLDAEKDLAMAEGRRP